MAAKAPTPTARSSKSVDAERMLRVPSSKAVKGLMRATVLNQSGALVVGAKKVENTQVRGETGRGVTGAKLSLGSSAPAAPSIVMQTSLKFMQRWAAGETEWNDGRAAGEVEVTGSEQAWDRMLVATQYPGRPDDLADKILAASSD